MQAGTLFTPRLAEEAIYSRLTCLPIESLPLTQCVGGTLRENIYAERDQPPFDRVAMDGMAVDSEALRRGVKAAAADGLLYGRPWGFALQAIRVPVHLWHGERDVVVPPSMGHYLAENIPNCRAQFYPEDGHFSLPFTRLRDILSTILP